MTIKKIGLFFLINTFILLTACGKNETQETTTELPPPVDRYIEAFGIIKAGKIKNINLDFPAAIKKIHVSNGQKVNLNDPLITLDLSNYNKQLQDKENEYRIAQLELQRIQAGETPSSQKESQRIKNELANKRKALSSNSDPDIQKLMNDLDLAQKSYEDAKRDYEKQQILYQQGAISESEFDKIKRNLEQSKNNVESLKLSVEALKNNKQKEISELERSLDLTNASLNSSNIEVEIQKQRILSLENEIALLKEKMNKPFIKEDKIVSDLKNAVVYEIGYTEGDNTDQSKKVLSLLDLDSLIIEANVSEEFIKDVKAGAPVDIILLADSSKKYKGKVTKISNMAIKENGETVVPIEISVDNKDSFLRPNFNVDVKIYK